MEAGASTDNAPVRKLAIRRGDHVVMRDGEGTQKVFSVSGDKSLKMGRYAALPLESIIGMPFGATLRYGPGGWARSRPMNADEGVTKDMPEGEVEENNQHLSQDGSAQALRPDQISSLKEQMTGDQVVAAIAGASATFASKTKFSQEKYIKKKQQKHVQQVTLLRPNVMELCETYIKSNRQKVCNLRFDYLSSLLAHAHLEHGGNYLVLDCAMGLVSGAMAQQLGGQGKVFRVYSGGCSDKCIEELDLPAEVAATIQQLPLDCLESAEPLEHVWACNNPTFGAASAETPALSEEEQAKREANRVARVAKFQKRRDGLADYLADRDAVVGSLDAMVIVAPEDDTALANDVIAACLPRLKHGGRLVVLGQHLQSLADRQGTMRTGGQWIDVRLMQLFTREYQVLPQRTHPHMAQDVQHCEGFILLGTRCGELDAVKSAPDAKRARVA